AERHRRRGGGATRRHASLTRLRALCSRFADAFGFYALIPAAGAQIFVLFGAAAGPVDHEAFGDVAFTHAKRDGQLGLREITRTALHHARAGFAPTIQAHAGADGVAVRFRPHQAHADAVVSGQLVVA